MSKLFAKLLTYIGPTWLFSREGVTYPTVSAGISAVILDSWKRALIPQCAVGIPAVCRIKKNRYLSVIPPQSNLTWWFWTTKVQFFKIGSKLRRRAPYIYQLRRSWLQKQYGTNSTQFYWWFLYSKLIQF